MSDVQLVRSPAATLSRACREPHGIKASNNTFDRSAGSHSLAAAGQRARYADSDANGAQPVNLLALGAMGLIALGALSSPFLLVWGAYCFTRPSRRAEGVSILAGGALAAGAVLIVGFLSAPPGSPGLFRVQALVALSGYFAVGAAAGKVLHRARSPRRGAQRRSNHAA
jgi:hypothetical protein